MGKFAEMMLDGTMCECCGRVIGEPVESPRLCEECDPKSLKGFIAWHPEHGADAATEDGGFFIAEEEENLGLFSNSPYSVRRRKEGWMIRPVEVRFTDYREDKKA